MKFLQYGLGLVNAVCVIVICLFTAICLPTFNMSFYRYEYAKNDVYANIPVESETLMDVTSYLLDYMCGKVDNLHVTAEVAGKQQVFFNEREQAHMVDVERLFHFGFQARRTACAGFIATLVSLCLLSRNGLEIVAKMNQLVITVFMGLVVCLAGLAALNFERAFTVFHQLFFTNDLWILDPRTDLLLNMVPLPFFIDIAVLVAVLFALMLALVLLVSVMLKKHLWRKNHARTLTCIGHT